MNKKNYWVSPNAGNWNARREGAERVSGKFPTQRAAENFARGVLRHGPGGELITQNSKGQIRSKDTINSNDPSNIKDKEH